MDREPLQHQAEREHQHHRHGGRNLQWCVEPHVQDRQQGDLQYSLQCHQPTSHPKSHGVLVHPPHPLHTDNGLDQAGHPDSYEAMSLPTLLLAGVMRAVLSHGWRRDSRCPGLSETAAVWSDAAVRLQTGTTTSLCTGSVGTIRKKVNPHPQHADYVVLRLLPPRVHITLTHTHIHRSWSGLGDYVQHSTSHHIFTTHTKTHTHTLLTVILHFNKYLERERDTWSCFSLCLSVCLSDPSLCLSGCLSVSQWYKADS